MQERIRQPLDRSRRAPSFKGAEPSALFSSGPVPERQPFGRRTGDMRLRVRPAQPPAAQRQSLAPRSRARRLLRATYNRCGGVMHMLAARTWPPARFAIGSASGGMSSSAYSRHCAGDGLRRSCTSCWTTSPRTGTPRSAPGPLATTAKWSFLPSYGSWLMEIESEFAMTSRVMVSAINWWECAGIHPGRTSAGERRSLILGRAIA